MAPLMPSGRGALMRLSEEDHNYFLHLDWQHRRRRILKDVPFVDIVSELASITRGAERWTMGQRSAPLVIGRFPGRSAIFLCAYQHACAEAVDMAVCVGNEVVALSGMEATRLVFCVPGYTPCGRIAGGKGFFRGFGDDVLVLFCENGVEALASMPRI